VGSVKSSVHHRARLGLIFLTSQQDSEDCSRLHLTTTASRMVGQTGVQG